MGTLKITQREQQIWAMIADGMTKKEVANELDRSFHTVNQIVRNLYDKLQIRKETELVREWFFHASLASRNDFKRTVSQKGFFVAVLFLSITGLQIATNAPAFRSGRTVSRTLTRTNQGRRKQTFYV